MMNYRINFDTLSDLCGFLDYVNFCTKNSLPLPIDAEDDLQNIWDIVSRLPQPKLPLESTNAKDLFIESLAQLNDSGDIDVLVRHLSWQQSDISNLLFQLTGYERNLKKLDESLQEIVRLKRQCSKMRQRNAELNKIIKSLKH